MVGVVVVAVVALMALLYQAHQHAQERTKLLDRIQFPEVAESRAMDQGPGSVRFMDEQREYELQGDNDGNKA